MAQTFMSDTQRELFNQICSEGELIFACGPKGVSANLVGTFKVGHIDGKEDLLEVGDGTDHVHIDWSRVTSVEQGDFHGEGLLSFKNGDEILFRLYRPDGAFSKITLKNCENLNTFKKQGYA
jgi:hypothetical protein